MKKLFYLLVIAIGFTFAACDSEPSYDVLAGHRFVSQDGSGNSITLTFYANDKCEVIFNADTYFKSSAFVYSYTEPYVKIYLDYSQEWKQEAWGQLFLQGTYDKKQKTITATDGSLFERVY